MRPKHIFALGASILAAFYSGGASAQDVLKFNDDASKRAHIAVGMDTLHVDFGDGITTLPVMCAKQVTAKVVATGGGQDAWLSIVSAGKDRVDLAYSYSTSTESRESVVRLSSPDGFERDVVVVQDGNTAASSLKGDTSVPVNASASSASAAQDGAGIGLTLDGNMQTIYHSPYAADALPVVLTYAMKSASHIDYAIYHPRVSGGSNGNFGEVLVEYATADAPDKWVTIEDADFGQSSSSRIISFGNGGVDNVSKVRFTVKSGTGGYASCAEMEFYQRNQQATEIISQLFTDELCTSLKPGVTAEQVNQCGSDYFRMLGNELLNGGYSDFQKKFRVGKFEPYETPSTLAARLKTSYYNQYENPTGIFFRQGKPIVVFAKGIGKQSVVLNVHDFANYDGTGDSSYPLMNGINVITPRTTGNGYVNYYVAPADTASAPDVELHFAMADVNGYFDAERGDTNADWQRILSQGGVSNIMDLRTRRVQVAYPTSLFRSICPNNAAELSAIIDDVVYREREILGLVRYKEEPRNRQFARIAKSGMFADGIGAGASDPSGWMQPSKAQFGYWGFAHELGHVNQVRPSFKWCGLGEATNNIYSAWAEFNARDANPWLRLESENLGVYDKDERSMGDFTGGRFNSYLQQSVLTGTPWLFASASNYAGMESTPYTTPDEDEDGNVIPGKNFTGPRRNFDHFVKLVPLWQLQLYGTQAGFAPDIYAKVLKGLRGATDMNAKGEWMTNGQQQIRFMRTVCDSTGLNFLPFFEKAGMLVPVKRIIEDYTPGLLNVSQKMIDELKAYVEKENLPTPEGEINYISGLNWQMYKDRAALVKGQVGEGCTRSGNTVRVDGNVWQNAVAFETYDAAGKMVAISMYGLGGGDNINQIRYTSVLFPSGSKTVKAVSWNGERAVCYEAE